MKKKTTQASPVGIQPQETFTDADGIEWTGVRIGSTFLGREVADKRGITETLKRRVRGEVAALAAIKEAHANPITPGAEAIAKHRLAPSERRSPLEWGTLAWYGNELALANDRIRLLEDERDRLLDEKRERDPLLLGLVETPTKISKRLRPGRGKNKPKDRTAWTDRSVLALARNEQLDVIAIADDIKKIEPDHTIRYLRKWVRENEDTLRSMALRVRKALIAKGAL